MAGLNECNFIGNLGKDPEVGVTPSGVSYAKASIAISESYKNAKGEKVENTEWIRLVFWRELADIVGKYCKKGDKLYVSGKMHTSMYEKDGEKKYSTDVIANKMVMLSAKKDSNHAPDESTAPPSSKPKEQGTRAEMESAQKDGLVEDIGNDVLPF